ncbi:MULTISPECIES: hypothetical protein [Acidithiobacillus]|uniref:Uncharacterized protein n=2 Tax=Acidithiobacillus TaxID=119977 RepID=A0A179B796_ACIFR|nr:MULTISPECIES: hypothetical protein [Acidithiobacillus]MEB8486567.1 hypothetical protein [Acidithiobacillus ferriphilus]MEB8491347.1 hypothetical protein [Acidithiobacillus ferriphilus]MEB8492421.1 hypothetical protein [Acidithiobacillus ferriphilus]MEB8515357.1 hypothetical protein [Acidithiobacillus ferriphilus]MEB8520573.1 hypothetical protein [Acidithiobacillus ferriphilus]
MTDNPSFPTVPRRTVFQVAQQAGYAGFAWIIRQVFWAFVSASTLFGIFFTVAYWGNVLPMMARAIIFYPNAINHWTDVFVGFMVVYLLWVLSYVTIRFMGRMAERYPILEKIGVGLLLLVILLLVAGMVYNGWSAKPVKIPSPPQKATFSTLVPSDRVLLHIHTSTPHTKKLPTHTSAALPPPPQWSPWTTTNMVGTATVKSLGHGRYEIQMIQPPRISRHQG